jgi:hypothetical protein
MRRSGRVNASQSGQVLILAVAGMLATIALISVIIDGGNVWAQQRIVQNGADASAEAGAVVMARRFSFIINSLTPDVGDAEVDSAVHASASANGLTSAVGYYTDICGIPLRANGSAALNPDGTEDLASAASVGGGIPSSSATSPDCPNLNVGPPAGVLVLGQKQVRTYLAGSVGLNNIVVATRATAVAGYLQDSCDSSQGNQCSLLPVTIPVNQLTCDGHNDPQPVLPPTPWVYGPVYKVPLCQNGPGNVGWIDWTGGGGGIPEIIDSVNNPDNPSIDLPSWQRVAETGNPNSAALEAALRSYDGRVVLIPQFDLTCDAGNDIPDSTVPAINTGPNYGCPAGGLGGNGSKQWYRMPSYSYFQFCIGTDPACTAVGAAHGAYTNGHNAVCDTGNGSTSCLIGRFVNIIGSGTVGPGVGGGVAGNKTIGVQLIK